MQRLAEGHKGRMPYSWFYFDLVKNVSKDKTFHSCQIPLKLVEMLIKSCTNEGDSVFILFGGSGGEIVLCEQLKRQWISCELHKPYYEMILDRLKNKGRIREEFKLSSFQKSNIRQNNLFGMLNENDKNNMANDTAENRDINLQDKRQCKNT